jgi:pyruvate-formate lyase-activating enzyme
LHILVDIDGTIADNIHRLHHIQGPRKDWPAFFDAMGKDEPIPEMIALVKALSQARDVRLVYVPGRPDSHRDVTAYWLADHHRPDHTVKAEILRHLRDMGYDPKIAIDDREQVVQMWRRNGVRCLQCAPGNFEAGFG